jgi:hypothetical protein
MIAAQTQPASTTSVQQKYRGHIIAVYEDGEGGFGFSVFDGSAKKGSDIRSLFSRKAFPNAPAAQQAAIQAVDLAAKSGISGFGDIGGFNFGKIGKLFDKVGQGAADNAGIIGTVGGAVVGIVGGPAGVAAGMAAGGALGKTVQGAREAQQAKKEAKAQQAEAEKQAAEATAAAAADAAAADAAAATASTPAVATGRATAKAKPIWPWIAAGGGAFVILGGLVLWLALRKKD